jgi:hypothetical protein
VSLVMAILYASERGSLAHLEMKIWVLPKALLGKGLALRMS